jgi:hypothetical protein
MNREMIGQIAEHLGNAMLYWVFMIISFGQAEAMGYSGYVGSMLGALLACIILFLMTVRTRRV